MIIEGKKMKIVKHASAKKVLIIGDANSIWVKTIIERTHLPFGDQVSVLSFNNNSFTDFYRDNNINIYNLKSIKTIAGPINLFHNLYYVLKHYDLIVVHFVQPHRALLAIIGRMFSKKLLLVFWGSDILRANKNILVQKAIRKSSAMVIGAKEMENRFHDLYGYEYDNKIFRVNFGSDGVDVLNTKVFDQELLCKKYGIDDKKVILSIGYNNSPGQQHLKILEAVGSLSKEQLNNIHILLRLSYGNGDADYINSIKKKVDEIGCSSTFFESLLSKEEIAETTSLADVFVHALITDARSASMCEHLFAGALVIIPNWINYDIGDKFFALKYDNFEQLKIILSDNIIKKRDSKYKNQIESNRRSIYDICSWEVHAKKWRNLY